MRKPLALARRRWPIGSRSAVSDRRRAGAPGRSRRWTLPQGLGSRLPDAVPQPGGEARGPIAGGSRSDPGADARGESLQSLGSILDRRDWADPADAHDSAEGGARAEDGWRPGSVAVSAGDEHQARREIRGDAPQRAGLGALRG